MLSLPLKKVRGSNPGKRLKKKYFQKNSSNIFLLFFQGNINELESIIEMRTGMMNYISKFWRGYYPLLLVEVQSKDSSFEDVSFIFTGGRTVGYRMARPSTYPTAR